MKSVTVWMCVCTLVLLPDEAAGSWGVPSALPVSLANSAPGSSSIKSGPGAQPEWVNCIEASEMCNQDPQCSSWYRVMRQCLVGKEKDAMLDNNRECQAALEVLLVSPLYNCRCKRSLKTEQQCLQIYWSINMGRNEDEDMEDLSPYEPVAPNWHPDTSRLASISSAVTVTQKGFHCPDTERDCNPCLDAAKACNLNGSCKRQRASYINICSKADFKPGETCSRKRCHKALRTFIDRVPSEFTHRLLFCPCQTTGCAERRRQTIVPDCSYKDKEKPNCLELRKVCHQDPLCRSRLADYKENCGMTPHAANTCPNQDNHQACLASFARLVGTDVTPNYVDSSFSNWTISPWCTCKGSGNQEEECQNFLRYFTNNACLRNAIQAFGYGIDNTQNKSGPVPGPSATPKPDPVSTQEISENLPVTIPKRNGRIHGEDEYHQPRGGVVDLGEDHSSCLYASVWALLPSLALALVLAQHAL
ncbi:GDNF family receptor alpha-2-like isoform X2 [Pelmatolapia mariae]|uniref:GDNF family receptor alpha-2-like isoform X2 n=1 Tax=Pelmatolapia mariae TaxID=158779 RepID=UPI002FE5C0C8